MFANLPKVYALGQGAVIDGVHLSAAEALGRLARQPHLMCHRGFLIARLQIAANMIEPQAWEQRHLDVAELFCFVCPAQAAVPTPQGLARALGVSVRGDDEALHGVADMLLSRLADPQFPHLRETAEQATFLAQSSWPWAKPVMTALLQANPSITVDSSATGLNVWDRLEEWEERGPPPRGEQQPVKRAEALALLRAALDAEAEPRQQQQAYVEAAIHGFAPRESPAFNAILLAEAGTGLGKTLGYLAPALLWAKKNGVPVWLSTYTKNLQRQLDQEAGRLMPDASERREKVVIRKGRENYLCLLNMQEIIGGLQAMGPREALLAVLLARWARTTRDGDLIGGDLPSWIFALFPDGYLDSQSSFPSPQSLRLTDRRNECISVACAHYRRCFIEKNQRAARHASLVIANHALVLHQAAVDHALGLATTEEEEGVAPGGLKRIVFDEGHHLFDAADSAFSSHLTVQETAELRRWLLGPESERRRGRGLRDRLEGLVFDSDGSAALLDEILNMALVLPGPGYLRRLQEGRPQGPAEVFFVLVRQQVLARDGEEKGFGRETSCFPLLDGLGDAAYGLLNALELLKLPMARLARALQQKLVDQAAELSTSERGRIEAVSRSLRRRGELVLGSWVDMLARLNGKTDPSLVDWFSVEHSYGHESDVGMHSHWLDPTEPLAVSVLRPADGVIITSATLKDRPPELPDDWKNAEMRTGVAHLPYPVRREQFESPFDYANQAKVIVVTDLSRENMDQLAAAYRELFLASGGGALGLFTAIARLKAVHKRLAKPLSDQGLQLFAQHVDPMDTATLVDLFRAERDACLLGTDALRDGIDVPGESLRLIVMDRVPWATPTILETARRKAFGAKTYVDMVVRLRLRQAFGRLIRSEADRGCFVILDSRLAWRFATAFPEGVTIERMGLVDAIETVCRFCKADGVR